nr:MAG TPA: hypothetical protein [Caudoviricetes sp.]
MSYYLEKGFKPDEILNLSPSEKAFYLASADFWADAKKGSEK